MGEIKTRQIEKEILEPTKVKIFNQIKDSARWKQHRPDVLMREIQKYMQTEPEPKKKRKKKKIIEKDETNQSTEQEHINKANRQFEPFVFGPPETKQKPK